GPRPPAVSPLEQPIETGAMAPRPIPTVEPLTYRTTAFAASGNEPFWSVQINGNTATYRTPENGDGRGIQVNRLTFDEGVEYIGVLDGRPFALNLRAARCRDSMSGKRMPLTARLTVTGDQYTGCAAPAQAAPATAEAPAEPAPAG
ncbi:MAG: COG3650 family protein, partial [Paracoccus sp. (in: a-proteobacteria)]